MLLYNSEQDAAVMNAISKKEKGKKRDQMLERFDPILEMAVGSKKCMMRQVLAYFGEEKEKTCKHCTNCQKNRRK